jgi:DNA-binding MarR family transcriptional regulator
MDFPELGNNQDVVIESAQTAMDGDHRQEGLVSLLTQLSKALHRRTSEEVLGMRLKQYLTLGYVNDHGKVSQQQLEAALMVDANAVVLLLNELEAAGWSVRVRDPQDRRRHFVQITPAGRKAVERAEKAREGLEGDILSEFSPEERATLKKLLGRLLDSLLRATPEPAKT